jgi:tetratricopeptide (TPR) repeat protein
MEVDIMRLLTSVAYRVCLGIMLVCFTSVAAARDTWDCGELKNAYGPYDYADPQHRPHLPIVEGRHFTRRIETLKSGNAMADIDYTLRAFPNHHRALYAMAQYFLQNTYSTSGKYYTPDCYFDRAMRFRANDPLVRMVYGIYLQRKGELKDALGRYNEAFTKIPDLVELNYNMGLLYIELGNNKKALFHARKVYNKGYPLDGLKNMLKRKGLWTELQKTEKQEE